MADLEQRTEGGVLRITLNRPDAKNALTPDQRDEIIATLDAASDDPDVRAIVISGSGGSFCSGADLRASRPATRERVQGDVARLIATGAQRLIASILDCEKPIVASVDGVAAGIGAHIAFASDLVIASEDARFIEIFVRRGLVPDGGGAYLLVRLIGPQKAKELIFFGGDVHAADAREMGLVNCVVPASDLEAATTEWATRLAAGPTRTIAIAKKLINSAHDVDRAAAFHDEAWAQELNMGTEDATEGVKSFVERREPDFKGR
ncbi:MAG: enoyl-CoA hydratase-related protein [Actinomycetota bacterium]